MKRLFVLAGIIILAMTLAVACDPEPKNEETLEVNETNLAGTWEKYIEHDFARGYEQKYRITFSGKNYTMWHMYQELKREDGEWKGLTYVGDKYTGTWEYVNGVLKLTHKTASSSYFISNMSPLEYTYYSYNVETMESTPWYETREELVKTFEMPEWPVKSLTKTVLTVKINMDTFALEKK